MKFKVLSEDIFRLSAIMVEVNENVLRKFQKRRKEALPADYWDFLPKDSHQEESGTRPNRRILSHAQVALSVHADLWLLDYESFPYEILLKLLYGKKWCDYSY